MAFASLNEVDGGSDEWSRLAAEEGEEEPEELKIYDPEVAKSYFLRRPSRLIRRGWRSSLLLGAWSAKLIMDAKLGRRPQDDEEKKRIDLLIGNLENRRPRTGTIQKTKRKGFSRLPLSPGAISPPKRNKKKETLEKEKPPSVDVMVKKKNVFPSAALPVNAQPSPLPAARPPKSAEEKKNTNRKKEKKRGKMSKEKNKKKKVAGFL